MSPPVISRARAGDLEAVLGLLTGSARWMHGAGWNAWPAQGFPAERIEPGIEAGTVWLLRHQDVPIATLTLDTEPDAEFLAPEAVMLGVRDMLPQSRILHRLAVDRALAGQGYGPLLLQWCADHTWRQGARWVLANVAKGAPPLLRWYVRNKFERLAVVHSTVTAQGAPRKSGALHSRKAEPLDLSDRLAEKP